jgi:UDP-hydrolysing UDP-N-acetyl-D-glucosamine 2-epimerase
MVASMSDIMEALRSCYRQLDPDLVITLTDRYETLAVASTAALMNIPIAHIQGGEVTGTIDESIRHAVTKLSHLHFTATDDARMRVIQMGEDPQYVFNVGCPATDLLLQVDTTTRIIPEPYVLVLMHPVTTEYGEAYGQMEQVIKGVKAAWLRSGKDGLIVVVGPNHDAGSHGVWKAIKDSGLSAPNQVPFNEWVNLMAHAEVLVGNSSSGIREACYFGTPTVDIGTRQQGRMPRGRNVKSSPVNRYCVTAAVLNQLNDGRYAPEYLYGNGNAGALIARILGEIELPPIQKRFHD